MRTLATVGVVALLVLAGCSAPLAVDDAPADRPPADGSDADGSDADGSVEDASVESRPGADRTSEAGGGPDPYADPARDVQGWERGRWYDEPLAIDPTDGLDRAERESVVARAMARVERVRSVEFERSVRVDVVTRDEFADGDAVGGSTGGPEWERLHRNARYEALFLVGEGTDGGETRDRNDRQSVQGYYSVADDRVVVVSPTETPRISEGTLAQELFHAYQYRHLVPDRVARPITADRIRAIVSVIEGDANLVEYRYRRRCGTDWSCVDDTPPGAGETGGTGDDSRDGGGDGGDAGIHMGLYLLQYFPYAEGEGYVRRVQADEGWEGVNRLYDDLPTSTAEVIHDERRPPPGIELPVGGDDGWSVVERAEDRVDYQTLGEAGLASMVAYTLYDDSNDTALVDRSAFLNRRNGSVDGRDPLDYGLAATDGWRGDRLVVYRRGEATGYVWRVRLADAEAADRFAGTYRSLLSYHGARRVAEGRWRIDSGPFADAFYVDREGDTITIVNAPSMDDAEAIYPPLG